MKLSKWLLLLPLALIPALALVFVLASSRSSLPQRKPYASDSPLVSLRTLAKSENLPLEGSPIQEGTTITASISGVRVLFSSERSLATQAKALQLVLGKIKMEGKLPLEIDLRFNKVVLKYK